MKKILRKIPLIAPILKALDSLHDEQMRQRARIAMLENQVKAVEKTTLDVFDSIVSADSTMGVSATPRNPRLVVSLTSIPSRMDTIRLTLYSLLRQSVLPDAVVLWLGEDKFPGREADLPADVLKLRGKGLQIRWCKDMRAYTKLIPSLMAYPSDVIITADDDIVYRNHWLETLVSAHGKHPGDICCHRCHYIQLDNGMPLPYAKWEWNTKRHGVSARNFITGVGGVLYPPGCFHKDVLDSSIYTSLTPSNDDIWYWAMGVLNGTGIRVVEGCMTDLIYAKSEQEGVAGSLYFENSLKNDTQLLAVLRKYPEVLETMRQS